MNRVLATLFILSVAFSGCSTPYSPPKVYGEFEGIKSLSQHAKTVKVIAVHGITTTSEGWASAIRQELEQSLQLTPRDTPPERIIIHPQGMPAVTAGYLNVYRYGSFEFYELTWSPTTSPLKDAYLNFDHGSVYMEKRAKINDGFKSGLVDDGLSDAIIYLGPTKHAMQDTVAQSLCYALVPNAPSNKYCDFAGGEISAFPDDQVIFITHSLGSRMAYDTLLSLADEGALANDFLIESSKRKLALANAQAILVRTPAIFMLANQLPLIELSVLDSANGVELNQNARAAKHEGFNSFLNEWSRVRKFRANATEENKLQVIAFSDPNDLLSYTLCNSNFAGNRSVKFADVIVSNATTYVGALEIPTLAHSGYMTNPDVIKLVVDGQKIPAESCGRN